MRVKSKKKKRQDFGVKRKQVSYNPAECIVCKGANVPTFSHRQRASWASIVLLSWQFLISYIALKTV